MGGGSSAPPAVPGSEPLPVPEFSKNYPAPTNPFKAVQPPASMKGGSMQGIPSLNDLFNRVQGAAPLFPNSQAFPQPPFVNKLASNPLVGPPPETPVAVPPPGFGPGTMSNREQGSKD